MKIDKKERKNGTFSPSRQVGTETARRAESCASDRILFSAFGLGYEVCMGKVLFLSTESTAL